MQQRVDRRREDRGQQIQRKENNILRHAEQERSTERGYDIGGIGMLMNGTRTNMKEGEEKAGKEKVLVLSLLFTDPKK
jgi:hypothetical protein